METKEKKLISFQDFEKEFFALKDQTLFRMNPYYKKIDLHFQQDNQSETSILYVSGYWEILNSGESIIDEFSSQTEIIAFFKKLIGIQITSIEFFEDSLEVFFEFSNSYTLHVKGEKDGHWIELFQRNIKLISINSEGQYFRESQKK